MSTYQNPAGKSPEGNPRYRIPVGPDREKTSLTWSKARRTFSVCLAVAIGGLIVGLCLPVPKSGKHAYVSSPSSPSFTPNPDGESAERYDTLGQECLERGELDEADQWWSRSISLDDQRPTPWILRGHLAVQTQRLDDALAYFQKALELDPKSHEAAFSLGRVQRLRGEAGESERYFRLAAEIRRNLPPPTGGMGAMPDPAVLSSQPSR